MKHDDYSLDICVAVDNHGSNKLDSSGYGLLVKRMVNDLIIIGVDEVGRGCVYGPVVCVAAANLTGWHLAGIRDSKTVKNEEERRSLANEIRHAMVWSVASASADTIDRFGIQRCVVAAGMKAAKTLVGAIWKKYPGVRCKIVFDGRDHESKMIDTMIEVVSIEKADATVFEVSAASILAKVIRDNWVHDQVKANPPLARYDLDNCKGYGSVKHAEALRKHGLTIHHRKKFCETLLTPKDQKRKRNVNPAAA